MLNLYALLQACEFDYSGTQACKALRQEVRPMLTYDFILFEIHHLLRIIHFKCRAEGYRVVLLNSNPVHNP